MIEPLFNAEDDEWVWATGRYILNMGAVEAATRLLIVAITDSDAAPIFSDDLAARIGFVRRRFPRAPADRHQWAMNVFGVAIRHTTFRNIVAHSPLALVTKADGTLHIGGIFNVTPNDRDNVGHLVSLAELKGRIDESAAVARDLLAMQNDFQPAAQR